MRARNAGVAAVAFTVGILFLGGVVSLLFISSAQSKKIQEQMAEKVERGEEVPNVPPDLQVDLE